MSNPNRLAELRRHRAMIQEHLAWLDREIDAAANGLPLATTPPTPLKPASIPPVETPVLPASDRPSLETWTALEAHAESTMENFRIAPADIQSEVRRGCFLYFAAALVIVGGVIATLYLLLRH